MQHGRKNGVWMEAEIRMCVREWKEKRGNKSKTKNIRVTDAVPRKASEYFSPGRGW